MMRDIYISGGYTDDGGDPLKLMQKYNSHTDEYSEMPFLIEARCNHASIVSGQYLYAFGGRTTGKYELSRSIEMLNLLVCQAWEKLITDDDNVARENAAVTAINPLKLLVFGGTTGPYLPN